METSKESILEKIFFAKRNRLLTFSINDTNIKELPKEIGVLEHLQWLDLAGNDLKKIPKEIGDLKNLQSLNLSGNSIKKLPKEISELYNLNNFDLHGNELSEIPKEFSELISLKRLNLANNMLKELPQNISEFKNLQWLNLSGNNLTKLPSGIGKLIKLEGLDLCDNKISELPNEIGYMLNIESLNLSNNLLSELPEEICNLRNLKFIYLSDNKINIIKSEFCDLKNLENINLSNNKLIKLPKEIGQLKKLKTLNLSNNNLNDIPKEISFLDTLSELVLFDNALTPFLQSYNLDRIKNLYLNGKKLKKFLKVINPNNDDIIDFTNSFTNSNEFEINLNFYEIAMLEFTSHNIGLDDIKKNNPKSLFYFTTKTSYLWAVLIIYLYNEKNEPIEAISSRIKDFVYKKRHEIIKTNSIYQIFEKEFNVDMNVINNIYKETFNSLTKKELICEDSEMKILDTSFIVMGCLVPVSFTKKTDYGVLVYRKKYEKYHSYMNKEYNYENNDEQILEFNIFKLLKIVKRRLSEEFV
jgi:Leucine-rich repeat (LRR) protein